MNKIYPKLYKRDSGENIREWWIEQSGDSYTTHSGISGGSIVSTKPVFAKSKNVGKKNETSAIDQATKEIGNLYKKQKRINYFENLDDIDSGFLKPQGAKPCAEFIDKVEWGNGIILDDKLNGFACFTIKSGAFTKTNKQYHAIPHIIEELKETFKKFPNAYLQGELFNPKYVRTLNKISELISVGRKPSDLTPELLSKSRDIVEYHLYDGYNFEDVKIESPNIERRLALEEYIKKNNFKYIKLVNYDIVYSRENAEKLTKAYIAKGGEGKIARNPSAPYQHKKTKDLLKLKKNEDAEFEVIELIEGTGDWIGCAKAAWCKNPEGKRDKDKKFKTNIEGEREHLRKVWENRDYYPKRWITIRFQERSEYNVPQIPYSDLVIRKEIEG